MSELEITNQPDIRLPKEKKVKIYRALVSQSGTAVPTVTVLQNTLGGAVTWARDAVGIYTMTTAGLFTQGKTLATISQSVLASIAYIVDYGDLPNVLYLETAPAASGINTDGKLFNNYLEILVYA